MTARPKNIHDAYHAHVYFDAHTARFASELCAEAGKSFEVKVGRLHQKLVGPHPRWSCQLAFDRATFDALIPWLDERRKGLTVFVHGVTGDDLEDHTTHASWLGREVALDLSVFGA